MKWGIWVTKWYTSGGHTADWKYYDMMGHLFRFEYADYDREQAEDNARRWQAAHDPFSGTHVEYTVRPILEPPQGW